MTKFVDDTNLVTKADWEERPMRIFLDLVSCDMANEIQRKYEVMHIRVKKTIFKYMRMGS